MLEDPSEATVAARCHPLPGDIPDEDQLAAKVDVLQEKLNEKRELLLERNLVLDEVVSLVDTLRTKAADGRSSTLDVAKKINEYQARIRALTQKMMATVSELSMYASGVSLFFFFFSFESVHLVLSVSDPNHQNEQRWGSSDRPRQAHVYPLARAHTFG
jgi:hypothetical protein